MLTSSIKSTIFNGKAPVPDKVVLSYNHKTGDSSDDKCTFNLYGILGEANHDVDYELIASTVLVPAKCLPGLRTCVVQPRTVPVMSIYYTISDEEFLEDIHSFEVITKDGRKIVV